MFWWYAALGVFIASWLFAELCLHVAHAMKGGV